MVLVMAQRERPLPLLHAMKTQDLVGLDVEIGRAALDELPALVGALARLQALALARLSGPSQPVRSESASEDRLLTPTEAARVANLPDPDGRGRRRIYEWARGQRWATRPSRKTLRVSEQGFRRWLMTRTS